MDIFLKIILVEVLVSFSCCQNPEGKTMFHECRNFKEYGEEVLKRLVLVAESDPNLTKAPVNYEGVGKPIFERYYFYMHIQLNINTKTAG